MTFTWTPDFTGIQAKWDAITDTAIKERSLVLATAALQMLTNNRVGTPPITIRPCPEDRLCAHDWEPYRMFSDENVVLNGGRWLNPCGCRTARWCAPLNEIDIPGPVGFIDRLKVDGAEVDITTPEWRLDNGHLLVWQGTGPSPIPRTQDLNKPDTEVGTWSLTYSNSYPVSAAGRIAVAWLALEFTAAFKPTGKCALPRGVTNVVRSGVSFTIEAGMFPNGLTGIDAADSYILSWTPPGSPTRTATVFDPRKRHDTNPRIVSKVPRRTP